MADDFYGFEEDDAAPKGRDHLFLWTVFILLLIGISFACWLGSFYVFGHPEQPRAYRILQKLGKIEPPRRFEATAAPAGDFLGAQKLFERYGQMSRLELERENAELLRVYINNYRETHKKVPYVRGRFIILDSYVLQETDIFPSGVVALAQSVDFPQVLIEHIYTAAPDQVPAVREKLQTGLEMNIEKTLDLSAVIHVERIFDGRLQFTVIPLLYGTYALKHGSGTFALEPPKQLNLDAGVPVFKAPMLEEGLKRYAAHRRTRPGAAPEKTGPGLPSESPELVRLDAIPEGVKVPPTGALPEMPVATPRPIAGRTARAATPPQTLAMNTATPRPGPSRAPAAPVADESPDVEPPSEQARRAATALPVATPLPAPPLKPFIASNPAPGLPSADRNWRMYAPGRIPPGRRISPEAARELADRGDLDERLYLRGQFQVRERGDNIALLRPHGGGVDPSSMRIIVQYPSSAAPPSKGSTFTRDDSRPFEITHVRRGEDGQMNIYVREITAP